MKNTDESKLSVANTAHVSENNRTDNSRLPAEFALSPIVMGTNTAVIFSPSSLGKINLIDALEVMEEKVGKIKAGDLSDLEATLTAQAITLDAVFNELARRASGNMGKHLNATETYLRMAFKAQAQCRATLETLAEIKYPKAPTFVRQQNVAYQQQVNNEGYKSTSRSKCVEPTHGKNNNPSNELLRGSPDATLDTRGTSATSSTNLPVEAVGKVNWPENKRRKIS